MWSSKSQLSCSQQWRLHRVNWLTLGIPRRIACVEFGYGCWQCFTEVCPIVYFGVWDSYFGWPQPSGVLRTRCIPRQERYFLHITRSWGLSLALSSFAVRPLRPRRVANPYIFWWQWEIQEEDESQRLQTTNNQLNKLRDSQTLGGEIQRRRSLHLWQIIKLRIFHEHGTVGRCPRELVGCQCKWQAALPNRTWTPTVIASIY